MSLTSATKPEFISKYKRGWRLKPEEEYIWSMRFYINNADRSGKTIDDSDVLTRSVKIENQVKIFASFLPDEALIDINDYTPREIECCLLYAKITGMHTLADRRNFMKSDFKIKLSNQLNTFFGAMVQEILSNGGDIIKFSPSALVVIWKLTTENFMAQNVHTAIDCALVIRKEYGKFILESGEKLRVDFAITAGSIYFSLIGNKEFTKYIIFGSVFEEVRSTRKSISVDNIIVSPAAMKFIRTFEYSLESLEGTQYYQVIGLTRQWKQVRKNDFHENSTLYMDIANASFTTLNTLATQGSLNSHKFEFCLRPLVYHVVDRGRSFLHEIGKFFPPGIRDGMLSDEPIENIMEYRYFTVASIIISTSDFKYLKKWNAANDILKIIHSYVVQHKGYVSYASILEKNIKFNILFGIKGVAHVMQHRSALRCSLDIMKVLRDYPKIINITIGVNTGRAYFTVIGHALRQDLSLFGKTVLEAISLAVNFENKIVCNQDTFIHSRMKHNCFSLIKEEIWNDENLPEGLIYELISDDFDFSDDFPIYDHPIVGRDQEITLCENLYKKYLKKGTAKIILQNTPNAVFIKGYPREGKSRLLHELMIRAPKSLPVHLIKMHLGENKITSFFIRKLFSIAIPADLMNSTIEEKEKVLNKLLKDIPQKNILWSINKVFNVKFPETAEFRKFSSEEKVQIKVKVLQHLCKKVFPLFRLILVDDADNVDDDSWNMLESLLQTKTFFLILTRSRDYRYLGVGSKHHIVSPCIKKIKLENLDPNYVSGLVCQHLGVFALPADLDYIIQKKSHGNIGFVKNLLTNFQQRNYFTMIEGTFADIINKNLVAPALSMIMKLEPAERKHLMLFIAKKGQYEYNEFKRILWFLFVEYFENEQFYEMRKNIYEYILKTDKIRICLLEQDLDINTIPDELTMSINITQLFELLSYHEQMIMKACSSLGDIFSRKTLEYILNLDYYNLLAPAIKSFYEAGILCCAQGDFFDGAQYVVTREKCSDPRFNENVVCKCKGIFISDRTRTLPDYAYCGLLRFRYSKFREHIYDLMLEKQKLDIHARVLIFLHEETKRCRSCGRDSFAWDRHTKRLDEFLPPKKLRREEQRGSSRSLLRKFGSESNPINTTMHQIFYEEVLSNPKYSTGTRGTGGSSYLSLLSYRDQDVQAESSKFGDKKMMIDPTNISKLRKDINLVRSFANSDFTYCECPQILNLFYREMMVHCRGAGQKMQLLNSMQNYAYLLISSRNISEAQLVLKQAFVCINDIFESDHPPPIWRKNLLEAKISTILAKCCREIGLPGESFIHLKEAMEKYGLKFKRNKITQTIKITTSKVEEILTFYLFPEMHTKTLSVSICEYNNDIAEALNMYAQGLMVARKWKEAQAVAFQALYRALNAQTDFARICDCFSTLLSILIFRRKTHLCIALEVYALKFCYRKRDRVESEELSAVCRLYMRVFAGKLNRAELDYCIHMGYIIIRLSASLNDTQALLFISVNLINVLMGKLYLQEAASLLLELEFCTDSADDTSGQIWFHCQALLFHIEVGYCIIPYEQCVNFLQIRSIENIDQQNDDATERLTILMWLWCLRNEHYERAVRFDQIIKDRLSNLSDMTTSTVLTLLMVLQGLLLLAVHKMNRSSIKEVRKLDGVINALMKCIQYETNFIRVLRSRLYTMKAFYYHIKNQEKKAHKWLDRSSALAKKQGMVIVVEWNEHIRKAWKNELPKKKMDFWKDHCEENNLIFYQEYDTTTDEIGFFTLPTPLYV